MSKQKTGIIYCRKASITSKNGESLEKQESDCRAMARVEGVDIVEVISDCGSGLDPWRKGLVKLLFLANSEGVDVVYVSSIDRLTRDMESISTLSKALGASVQTVKEHLTLLSPSERLTKNIILSMVRYEHDMRSRGRGSAKKCDCGSKLVKYKANSRNRNYYGYLECKNCRLVYRADKPSAPRNKGKLHYITHCRRSKRQ